MFFTILFFFKEEVALNREDVDIVGMFSPTFTVGSLQVFPVIAVVNDEDVIVSNSPQEVRDIFWMPLSE